MPRACKTCPMHPSTLILISMYSASFLCVSHGGCFKSANFSFKYLFLIIDIPCIIKPVTNRMPSRCLPGQHVYSNKSGTGENMLARARFTGPYCTPLSGHTFLTHMCTPRFSRHTFVLVPYGGRNLLPCFAAVTTLLNDSQRLRREVGTCTNFPKSESYPSANGNESRQSEQP